MEQNSIQDDRVLLELLKKIVRFNIKKYSIRDTEEFESYAMVKLYEAYLGFKTGNIESYLFFKGRFFALNFICSKQSKKEKSISILKDQDVEMNEYVYETKTNLEHYLPSDLDKYERYIFKAKFVYELTNPEIIQKMKIGRKKFVKKYLSLINKIRIANESII